MSTQRCYDCGQPFDNTYQRGRCPHDPHEPELIERLEFVRDHPSYAKQHDHVFNGHHVSHYHYVVRDFEDDPKHHRHPVLAARYGDAAPTPHTHVCKQCGCKWGEER